MPKEMWQIIPDNLTLCDPSEWSKISRDRYKATRYYLAILQRKETEPKTGPQIFTVRMREGVKPIFGDKDVIVVTNTVSITETIQRSFTSKIAAETSFKNALSVKDGLSAEAQAKLSSEVTEALSKQLSGTVTYQVQSTHEFMSSMSLEYPKGGDPGKELIYYFYLPLWPVQWDIYLYQEETLELTYRRQWFERGLRNILKKVRYPSPPQITSPRLPLVRLSFYEPQKFPVAYFGSYTPEVADPDKVTASTLTDPCPSLKPQVASMSLEECARIAFPETEDEVKYQSEAVDYNKKKKRPPITRHSETRASKTMTKRAAGGVAKGGSKGGTKSGVTRIAGRKGGAKGAAKSGAGGRAKGGVRSGAKGRAAGGAKGGAAKGGGRGGSKGRGGGR